MLLYTCWTACIFDMITAEAVRGVRAAQKVSYKKHVLF